MTAYLGLGSNVGDRRANLQAAVDALPGHGVQPVAASSVYDTEPVGEITDQPEFLNACLRVETDLGPEALLDACKAVERDLGREPGGPRHGPRPDRRGRPAARGHGVRIEPACACRTPRCTSRRFVLVPLLGLDPALTLPDGTRLAEALAALPDDEQAVRLAGAPLGV